MNCLAADATPLHELLKTVIGERSMTCHDIATKTGRQHSTVLTVIKRLKREKLVHVAGWLRTPGKSGSMEALYIWGRGRDAKKPGREPATDKPQRNTVRLARPDPLMRILFKR